MLIQSGVQSLDVILVNMALNCLSWVSITKRTAHIASMEPRLIVFINDTNRIFFEVKYLHVIHGDSSMSNGCLVGCGNQ